MIDNLTEAITHAREVAKDLRQQSDFIQDQEEFDDCCECAREHEQLAEWLTELQERREADRWIPVTERLPEKDKNVLVTDNEEECDFGKAIKTLCNRPQGEWVFVNPLQANDGGAYMCSNCKTGDYGVASYYKYCPFCGAQMKGGTE